MRDKKINTLRTSIEEVALYQMFLSEALFEIFLQKGLITDAEVTATYGVQSGITLRF